MNDTLHGITSIWQETLGMNSIGLESNFFEIGGNSIQIIKIIHAINERYSVDIEVEFFVANATIEALTTKVNELAQPMSRLTMGARSEPD